VVIGCTEGWHGEIVDVPPDAHILDTIGASLLDQVCNHRRRVFGVELSRGAAATSQQKNIIDHETDASCALTWIGRRSDQTDTARFTPAHAGHESGKFQRRSLAETDAPSLFILHHVIRFGLIVHALTPVARR
jgi:hypothetical protein